jgi:type IV pilus assembly protein PilE
MRGPPRPRTRGVTLIELMTAVVVLAVLAAIALPSYRSYVQRAQRTEATRALLQVRAAQEKFFLQNNRYADSITAAPPTGLGLTGASESGLYDLTLQLIDGGRSFLVTAAVRAGERQFDDARCAQFTLDGAGLRAARNSAAADSTRECWR